MGIIKTGNGVSLQKDSFKAGKESASMARLELNGAKPDLLIVFASPIFNHREMINGINKIFGDIPMVGGTTAGEISANGFSEDSVVVMAVKSKQLKFYTAISKNMSIDEKECAKRLAEKFNTEEILKDALSMIIFPNGMGGDGVQVIEGINDILENKVEIVGGYCGDGVNFQNSFQFFNGKVYEDAIAGLIIQGDKNIFRTGIGVRSGFESVGNKMYCTDSDGNIMKEIDGEPALDVYTEMLGEKRSERLPEVCLEYPFGLIDEETSIIKGDSEHKYFQLRCGLTVDHDNRTITLAGSVPDGSALTLTTGTRSDLITGARHAAQQAFDSLEGHKPEMVIMFSCVGRKLVLGRRVSEESLIIDTVYTPAVPKIGFYTYGEIGPINKTEDDLNKSKFHNETMVVWVLGSKC